MSVKCEKDTENRTPCPCRAHPHPGRKTAPGDWRSYQKIGALMGKYGEQPVDVPYVAYYNMDMQDLDVEIGFIVGRPLEGEGDVKAVIYPAGPSPAPCTKDPMIAWDRPTKPSMPGSRSRATNLPAWYSNIYLNYPAEVGPEEVLTRIEMLLK